MKIKKLPDIQKTKDVRGITINRVGVSNVDFPMYVLTKKGKKVLCYSVVNMYSTLPKTTKGTNMSRFLQVLMSYRYKSLSELTMKLFLKDLKDRVQASNVYADITFKYFLDKVAPVSKKVSPMAYTCSFIGGLSSVYHYLLKIEVPIATLCPCSKAISDKGAHNQRALVTVVVEPDKNKKIWIEDIVRVVEDQGSSQLYPILKRPDEKYVTEYAYNNPKFVEDVARDVALSLQNFRIRKLKVKVESFESIHNHNATCIIHRIKRGKQWISYGKGLKRL